MHYFLFMLFWSSQGPLPTTIDFDNEEACKYAGRQIQNMVEKQTMKWGSIVRAPPGPAMPVPAAMTWDCLPKGD